MIEITINVTNATVKEKKELEELYNKPINQLSKDNITLFYQDDKAKRETGLKFGVKSILAFQSLSDLTHNNSDDTISKVQREARKHSSSLVNNFKNN